MQQISKTSVKLMSTKLPTTTTTTELREVQFPVPIRKEKKSTKLPTTTTTMELREEYYSETKRY
ncbi:MAG: hypothetical protein LBM93_11410 [Oscillospiraceae bacterium]|jgi:hypothetical protein|nr:hypothetical protein [Oscillospiraceae bacterium]